MFDLNDSDFFLGKDSKNLKMYLVDASGEVNNLKTLDFIFDYKKVISKIEKIDYYNLYNFTKLMTTQMDNCHLRLFFKRLTSLDVDYGVVMKINDKILCIEKLSYIRNGKDLDYLEQISNDFVYDLEELYSEFDLDARDIPEFHYTKDYTEEDASIMRVNYLNKRFANNLYYNINMNTLCKYLESLKLLAKLKNSVDIDTAVGVILFPCNEYHYDKNYKVDYSKIFSWKRRKD
jgi:hypothetical protein